MALDFVAGDIVHHPRKGVGRAFTWVDIDLEDRLSVRYITATGKVETDYRDLSDWQPLDYVRAGHVQIKADDLRESDLVDLLDDHDETLNTTAENIAYRGAVARLAQRDDVLVDRDLWLWQEQHDGTWRCLTGSRGEYPREVSFDWLIAHYGPLSKGLNRNELSHDVTPPATPRTGCLS